MKPRSNAGAFTLLLAVCSTQCGSPYTVQGRVWNCADRRAIDGVTVHLSDGRKNDVRRTFPDGTFQASLSEPDGDLPSRITLSKAGYRTEEHTVDNPHVSQNICMTPETP